MSMRGTFSAWPMTPVVKKILIANVVIWLATIISVNWMDSKSLVDHLGLTPERVYPGWEVWQPFTYMWLHAYDEVMHILFNSLILWMFGGTLEQAWGSKPFIRFYLICGVGAGCCVLFAGWWLHPSTLTMGASGAIYGLVAAWAIAFPNKVIYLFGIFPIKGKWFALFPIVVAVLDFLMRKSSGVSHAAHLGGLAVGALLVTGFWRPGRLYNRLRYIWLKRKLTVLEGGKRKKPPDGGFWH